MPRVPRAQGFWPLLLATTPPSLSMTPSLAVVRPVSTTCAAQGKNTDWVRGKLWESEPPGTSDPYTQKPETEHARNVPEEALKHRPSRDPTPAAVRASGLVLPPKRTEAATEKEVKSLDITYEPATDAEGLEEIGTVKSWWDQPGHWGAESEFKGFGSGDKIEDRQVVEVYLMRAVVEVLALQETGVFSEWATRRWRQGGRSEFDQALAVEICVNQGKALLKGPTSAVSQSLTAAEDDVEPAEGMSLDEARKVAKAWDSSWKDLALDDQVKFALRKRLYQLTGNLIPDSQLGAARTVKHVLSLVGKLAKQPKLAQVLARRGDLPELPNVNLHSRKIGPIEKETAVGHWKVIEEELKKRNLPVTGTAGLSRNKERDWLMGKI